MLEADSSPTLSRTIARAAKETLLTALAIAGSVCIVAVLAGARLGISLIVFKTGSMSPEIEPGAIAVVREVPASTLEQGDIATVQREGSALPVTHRVVATHPDPADPAKVLLTMKGDANASEDPVRYKVQSAGKLVFAVPAVGYWVMHLQTPWIMGCLTVAMAALVTWTFWPKEIGPHPAGAE